MASTPIMPQAVWAAGTNQNSVPANDNSNRQRLLHGNIKAVGTVTAQPGSPVDGDAYILGATHTGAVWTAFFQNDLVIYIGGTWYAFAATNGLIVSVNGTLYTFDGTNWILAAGRTPNIQTVTSSATVTPTFSNDLVIVSAQAVGLTIAAPTGTAIDGAGLVIRIKDSGSSQTLALNAVFRAVGVSIPASTTAGKWLYIGAIYNAADTKWDVTAVALQA
jgi:hypothetical protein